MASNADQLARLKELDRLLEMAERIQESLRREIRQLRMEAGLVKKRGRRKYADTNTLSPGEVRVINHLVYGLTNKEIGVKLHVSHRTVKFHMANIFKKIGVTSRMEVIAKFGSRTIRIETQRRDIHDDPNTLPIGRRTA